MIIVHLIGGLGNQLFQYALGRRLAILNNTSLALDHSGFSTYYKLHKYSLQHFNIEENFISPEKAKKYRNLLSRVFTELDNRTGNHLGTYYKRKYIKERSLKFDKNIFQCLPDVYLEGFWQTEKYFKEIIPTLRKEFTFKTPPNRTNKELCDKITLHNAVSIHVRRADYVTDSATNKDHGVCGLDYYRNAIRFITEKVKSPHFYVFSDDMNWTKANLKIDFPVTYVDFNNADTNYEDLRLMSLCNHNIIANSSFSWWGAWLNQHSDKIVIAPKKWYNNPNKSSEDLIPPDWNKI